MDNLKSTLIPFWKDIYQFQFLKSIVRNILFALYLSMDQENSRLKTIILEKVNW